MTAKLLDEAVRVAKMFLPPRQYKPLEEGFLHGPERGYHEEVFLSLSKTIRSIPDVTLNPIRTGNDVNALAYLRYVGKSPGGIESYVYVYGASGKTHWSDFEVACLKVETTPLRIHLGPYRLRDLPGRGKGSCASHLLDISFQPTSIGAVRWAHRIPFDASYDDASRDEVPNRVFKSNRFNKEYRVAISSPYFGVKLDLLTAVREPSL